MKGKICTRYNTINRITHLNNTFIMIKLFNLLGFSLSNIYCKEDHTF